MMHYFTQKHHAGQNTNPTPSIYRTCTTWKHATKEKLMTTARRKCMFPHFLGLILTRMVIVPRPALPIPHLYKGLFCLKYDFWGERGVVVQLTLSPLPTGSAMGAFAVLLTAVGLVVSVVFSNMLKSAAGNETLSVKSQN